MNLPTGKTKTQTTCENVHKVLHALYTQVQRMTKSDQIKLFLQKNKLVINALEPMDAQTIRNALQHIENMNVSTQPDVILYLHHLRQLPIYDFIQDVHLWERYVQR